MNRLDVVGYLYDHEVYCPACMKADDGGDVEVRHVKAIFFGSKGVEGFTCTVCCETLIQKGLGKMFEVSIVYKGQRNYLVEAPDPDTASDFACAQHRESTGRESEEIENIVTKEVQ